MFDAPAAGHSVRSPIHQTRRSDTPEQEVVMWGWIAAVVVCLTLAGCRGASAPPGFIGPWRDGATQIWLNRDGTYAATTRDGTPVAGTWKEADGILTREVDGRRTQDRWEARDRG